MLTVSEPGETNKGRGRNDLIQDCGIVKGIDQVNRYLWHCIGDELEGKIVGGYIHLLTAAEGNASGEGSKVPTSVF